MDLRPRRSQEQPPGQGYRAGAERSGGKLTNPLAAHGCHDVNYKHDARAACHQAVYASPASRPGAAPAPGRAAAARPAGEAGAGLRAGGLRQDHPAGAVAG